jgi:hypothetical protein
MGELQRGDEEGKNALAGTTPARTQCETSLAVRMGYKCKLGHVILMMDIPLGTLASAEGMGAREKRLTYEGIQGLLENVAMGIEEKQAEMKEMDRSLSTKRMELIELEKNHSEKTYATGLNVKGNRVRHAQAEGRKEEDGG